MPLTERIDPATKTVIALVRIKKLLAGGYHGNPGADTSLQLPLDVGKK
jgi:hypothetical protein